MSVFVNTNVQSLFAQRSLGKNTMNMQKSLEKLSTGFKINRAGDDAAGLSISEGLTSEIRGLGKAKQNIGDGISLLQTAEGGLSVIQDNLQRIREIKVQAENGTNSNDELDALQREVNERITTIENIGDQVSFNGNSLLTGGSDFSIQTGANNNETFNLDFQGGAANTGIEIDVDLTSGNGHLSEGENFALSSMHLGGSTSLTAQDGSTTAETGTLAQLDTIIGNVSRMRSTIGAYQNSLESRAEYVDVAMENASASRSRIRDVDVASESSKMLKSQILQQSSASMLSQANSGPQLALNLLP